MRISDWSSDGCSSDLLRYTIERRGVKGFTQLTFLPVAGGGSLQTGLTDAHTTFKKLTWRIALDQQLAPGILAYASYNRGFKSGLYNSIPPSADVIQPEVLDAYEAGLKTELLDRRVRLNRSEEHKSALQSLMR